MAPRDWSKPKAEHLEARLLLQAIDAYNAGNGPWPPDAFKPEFPPALVLCKERKLEKQKLIARKPPTGGYFVTEMGRQAITEAE